MIALSELLGRLKGVQDKGGGQYMARCPVHDDKRASLALRMGNKGIVLNCRAGCPVEAVAEALGVSMRDLMADSPSRQHSDAPAGMVVHTLSERKKPEKPEKPVTPTTPLKVGDVFRGSKVTAEYVYQASDGTDLVRVYRTESKEFPQMHKAADGWHWGGGSHKGLLYRLPEVVAAVKGGRPVYVAEGEKDVETLRALDFCATTNKGGASVWPERCDELKDAVVYVLPDNDAPGQAHAVQIGHALRSVAAEVRTVDLRALWPQLPEHGDVSDVVAALGQAEVKARLPELAARSEVLSRKEAAKLYEPYYADIAGCVLHEGGIHALTAHGGMARLSNFVALPVEELSRDDGCTEPERFVRIKGWAQDGRRLRTLTVPIERFVGMGWALAGWGLTANISPRNGAEKQLRSFIQEAGSRAAVTRTVYTHTGWREIGGKPVFLHGGGAIGAENIGVELEYGFSRYDLSGMDADAYPHLSAEDRLLTGILRTQQCIELADKRITAPLIGFLFLTPLRHFLETENRRPSFVPFVRGRTGTGKSSLVALLLNHFGKRFSFEAAPPASFADSANGISRKLFVLKDMPLLVDDYHPESDQRKKREMDSVAQTISRMIGDGATRSRMNADTSAREDKPARGLCIETGEDLPQVEESGIGRLFVIDVRRGDIDLYGKEMMDMWSDAWRGVLSETMRGYIEYLLTRYEGLGRALVARHETLHREAVQRLSDVHKRMPTAAAYLMLGLDTMLDFFIAAGAMPAVEKPGLMDEFWAAVCENSAAQARDMLSDTPSAVFVDTLRELLGSGKATVKELVGNVSEQGLPQGMIGYRDSRYYYLLPSVAFGAVQRACMEQGNAFPLGKNMLMRTLREEGKLTPGPNGRSVRQLNRNGVHGWMLWMPRYLLDGGKPPPMEETAVQLEMDPFEGRVEP